MGQITPNMGIYIPAAGETNYDAPFAAGMINIDQHDHSGAPNKGVPIATSGIADGSITYNKLNANVADNTTGIGTASGGLANQLIILGLLKNIFQLVTTAGFISKDGSSAHARTIQPTANQTTVTNGDGVAGDPIIGIASTFLTSQPSLLVYNSAPIATAWGDNNPYILKFDTTVSGTGYSAATGLYTAPQTGNYLVCTGVNLDNSGGVGANAELSFDGTARDFQLDANAFVANIPNNFINLQGSAIVPMTAGDTLGVSIEGHTAAATKTGTFYGDAAGLFTWMSIKFLG